MRFLALLSLTAVLAQAPPPAQRQLQTLVLTVTNGAGQYVAGLPSDAFIVEEDGIRQETAKFAEGSDVPVSVGILIDKSASMRLPVAVQNNQRIPAALLAANGAAKVVLRLTRQQDEYLLMTFDEGLSVRQSFTTDSKKVTDVLNKNNEVGGSTHLYKAVADGLKEIQKKAKNRRRALIVITDVHDTSGDKVEDLQTTIRGQEVPVYTFGMRWDAWGVPGESSDAGKSTYEEAVLKMMAVDSGGHSMVVDIPDLLTDYTITRMIEFIDVIGAELRGQYTLSYYSTTPGPAASKAVRVRAVSPEFQVRSRRESDSTR